MTDATPAAARTLNAELAYRVLDHIEAHPENWNQGFWITRKPECGTAGCFAGWTAMLAGYRPIFRFPESTEAMRVTAPGDTDQIYETFGVADIAEQLLGERYLPFIDADGGPDEHDLFEGANTLDDLRRLVAEIFGPRPTPQP